jgi:hypothetical protein
MENDKKKGTDPDVKPSRGQESNENWDRQGEDSSSETRSSATSRRIDEETNTSGAGSAQKASRDNVGPLDADLEQLPSEKRIDRNNQTGPGLG